MKGEPLEFTRWELLELVTVYHERRNAIIAPDTQWSKTMQNRANNLFDKLRFAEFQERRKK